MHEVDDLLDLHPLRIQPHGQELPVEVDPGELEAAPVGLAVELGRDHVPDLEAAPLLLDPAAGHDRPLLGRRLGVVGDLLVAEDLGRGLGDVLVDPRLLGRGDLALPLGLLQERPRVDVHHGGDVAPDVRGVPALGQDVEREEDFVSSVVGRERPRPNDVKLLSHGCLLRASLLNQWWQRSRKNAVCQCKRSGSVFFSMTY